MTAITSPANDRIKRLARLQYRRHREAEGVFVVEGRRLLDRALGAGLIPVEVYALEGTNLEGLQSVEVLHCAGPALDRASYRDHADELIAVFPYFDTSLNALDRHPSLILVAEEVEKPGNLGAILRTADAVSADGVISMGAAVDPFNPNVLRASTGTIFSMPLAVAGTEEALAWIDEQGLSLVVATPAADTDLWDVDMTGRIALLVGAEDRGVSAQALQAADSLARLPMEGAADSLNTSATMAVLAYEAVRQRR